MGRNIFSTKNCCTMPLRNSIVGILLLNFMLTSCKNTADAIPITSYAIEMQMKQWDSLSEQFKKERSVVYEIYSVDSIQGIARLKDLHQQYGSNSSFRDALLLTTGELYYQMGDYRQAAAYLDSLEYKELEDAYWIAHLQGDQSVEIAQRAEQMKQLPEFQRFWLLGNYAELQADWPTAISYYQQCLLTLGKREEDDVQKIKLRLIECNKANPVGIKRIAFPEQLPHRF